MGLPLVLVEMAPVKPEEVVHERYHHGRIVGDMNPNKVSTVISSYSNPSCPYS